MPYNRPIIFGFVSVLALFSIVLTRFWGVLDPFFDPPRAVGSGLIFITFDKLLSLRRRNFSSDKQFFSDKKFAEGFSLLWAERFWMTERIVLETLRVIIHETLRVMLTLLRVSDWTFGITPTSERMTELIVYETLRVILL